MGRNITLLASTERTATVNTDHIHNAAIDGHPIRGVKVTLDVTTTSATPSVTFTIQGVDPTSGSYYTVLASSAITTVSTTTLTVYPGITAAANVSASDVMPTTWRLNCAHSDADGITYSASADLLS